MIVIWQMPNGQDRLSSTDERHVFVRMLIEVPIFIVSNLHPLQDRTENPVGRQIVLIAEAYKFQLFRKQQPVQAKISRSVERRPSKRWSI